MRVYQSGSDIYTHHLSNVGRFSVWRVNLKGLPTTWWVNVGTKKKTFSVFIMLIMVCETRLSIKSIVNFFQGQSPSIRQLIMHSMAEWYMRGEQYDQAKLSRILDVAQDLKVCLDGHSTKCSCLVILFFSWIIFLLWVLVIVNVIFYSSFFPVSLYVAEWYSICLCNWPCCTCFSPWIPQTW